jgi:hypothetical protein
MPVHVSDYVANVHFGTEQHSVDLSLPFHFLPLEILAGDDGLLARITRSAPNGWNSRAVPAEFLEIDAGYWHRRHTRQGRSRIVANPQANPNKARLAARGRWTTAVVAEVRAVDAWLRSDECNRYYTMRSRAWQCQIKVTTRVSAMTSPRFFRHHLRGGTTSPATQARRVVSA